MYFYSLRLIEKSYMKYFLGSKFKVRKTAGKQRLKHENVMVRTPKFQNVCIAELLNHQEKSVRATQMAV